MAQVRLDLLRDTLRKPLLKVSRPPWRLSSKAWYVHIFDKSAAIGRFSQARTAGQSRVCPLSKSGSLLVEIWLVCQCVQHVSLLLDDALDSRLTVRLHELV